MDGCDDVSSVRCRISMRVVTWSDERVTEATEIRMKPQRIVLERTRGCAGLIANHLCDDSWLVSRYHILMLTRSTSKNGHYVHEMLHHVNWTGVSRNANATNNKMLSSRGSQNSFHHPCDGRM